jgi:hypothetical protein
MTQTFAATLPAPAQQARNILRAWVRLDPDTLQREFSKGLALCSSSRMAGLEAKRLDLLRAAVERLDDRPAKWAARTNDPAVKLCISLLMNLADRGASERPAAR